MDDFDQFVAGNVEQLLKTAYLITWDAGEAEDLGQEPVQGRAPASSSR